MCAGCAVLMAFSEENSSEELGEGCASAEWGAATWVDRDAPFVHLGKDILFVHCVDDGACRRARYGVTSVCAALHRSLVESIAWIQNRQTMDPGASLSVSSLRLTTALKGNPFARP
jgi:hypothetical protein